MSLAELTNHKEENFPAWAIAEKIGREKGFGRNARLYCT